MAVPDFETLMLPLLALTEDKKEHTLSEAGKHMAKLFNLTEEEINENLPTGKNKLLNRLSWTRYYLKQADLISSPRKGVFVITDQGTNVLNQKLEKIDAKFLKQFQSPEPSDVIQTISTFPKTPDEQITDIVNELQKSLEIELLQLIKSRSPEFFERLIVDLYSKIFNGKGEVTGRTGDGGIDGIIKTDELGLNLIYLQAKKWEANVSAPNITEFAGSLQRFKAKKGIFVTTSDFASPAKSYVKDFDTKIILINGRELVSHMIKYDVGVKPFVKHEIKKIDTDYFAEEE
jgi:restriction system protein